MSYTINIRPAENESDCDLLLGLIEQLAEFERLTPPDAEARGRLYKDGFVRQPPRFEAWLAEQDDVVAGYAIVFETYSTFLCLPTLYLEDLFVSPEQRGKGIGRALLDHCISLAHERGCGRMEWTCLDWNVGAQAVYENLGASRMQEWYLYRLTSEAIESLSNAKKGRS